MRWDEHWESQGACKGQDPKLFFPDRGVSSSVAKAICKECPVKQECLDFALTHNIDFGIWGGTSARQRGKMRGTRRYFN